jgi:hypothetical protein
LSQSDCTFLRILIKLNPKELRETSFFCQIKLTTMEFSDELVNIL